MFTPEIYKGIVVSNNDPEEKSRLQVRILPELKDAKQEHLPWLRPFMYQDISNTPLEVNSHVWCFFIDEFWNDGYWISNQFIDGFYEYNEALEGITTISEIENQDYPQPHFKRYKDGTTLFHNSVTKDTGIYSPLGSYALLNKDGDIILSNTSNKATISKTSVTFSVENVLSIKSSDELGSLEFNSKMGTISLVSSKQIYAKSNNFALEASTKYENVGKIVTNCTTLIEKTKGGKTESVGGNKLLSIAGDFQSTIVGSSKETHLGKWEKTIANISGIQKISVDPVTGITIDSGLLTATLKSSTIVNISAGLLGVVNISGAIINLG